MPLVLVVAFVLDSMLLHVFVALVDVAESLVLEGVVELLLRWTTFRWR